MRRRGLVLVLAVGVVAISAHALRTSAQPAVLPRAVPPPTWARSVQVLDDAAPVFLAPGRGSKRRGTVRVNTRMPLLGRVAADGCSTGYWARVGESLYICERYVRSSPDEPWAQAIPRVREGEILPRQYAFVAFDGTRAFAHPRDYFRDDYVEAFGEGFGIVVAGHTVVEGVGFSQTRRGYWIEDEALRHARGSQFTGVMIADGAPLDVAWVLRPARVHARPRGRVVRRAGRRELVHVAEVLRGGWVRLVDGTFMRDRDLGRAEGSERPEEVAADEKWIDVSVDEQVLVAWRGETPLFATLISSGRASASHDTPRGAFRVWVKLAFSDMSDLRRQDVETNYAIEAVPWVQYFEGSNGLHAAFWHDEFGRRRSHGCVNLSPRDARFLFSFTEPPLPVGWKAILPTEADRATVVRVR